MRVGIFSTYDNSGAGEAACKINDAFLKNGIKSKLFVAIKKNKKSQTLKKNFSFKLLFYIRFYLNKFVAYLFCYNKSKKGFLSLDLFQTNNSQKINKMNIDIVQLNWINNFISISDISKINKPIVWRLSDMWPFIGVEHFTDNKKWKKKKIKRHKLIDFDYFIWKKKFKLIEKNIRVVTPSKWLAEKAKKSFIMSKCKIEVIPTPISSKIYKIHLKKIKIEKIPRDKFIVLFSAKYLNERRKGFEYFQKLTKIINKLYPNKVHFVTMGKYNNKILDIFPENTSHFGLIDDQKTIVNVYNSCHLIFILSKKDNLPQVALEANMCGLPIISFKVGGIEEMIQSDLNGHTIKQINYNEIKMALEKYINLRDYRELKWRIRKNAIKNYSEKVVVKKYKRLFENILYSK